MNKLKLTSFPFYPILFCLYPLLYLWSTNRTQEPAYVIIPSLILTVLGLAFIYLVTGLLLKSIYRAAIATTVIGIFVLAYGHFENVLSQLLPNISSLALLYIATAVILFLLAWIIFRGSANPQLARGLNLISIITLFLPILIAAPYYIRVSAQSIQDPVEKSETERIRLAENQEPRDVYFILIDNYGRQDVLQSKSHFDNAELINALKERGFIFPNCAQGNYFHTAPAITSILNMKYLEELGIADTVYSKRSGYSKMTPLLLDSEVMRKFHEYGYSTVTFRGFMGLIDIKNSDTYIDFEKDVNYTQRLETTNFNNLYYETTVFASINNLYKIYPDLIAQYGPDFIQEYLPKEQPLEDRFYAVYQQNLYAYEALKKIPKEITSPKFVYAHIYSAHWPFMMKPDGSIRLPFTEKITTEGYVDAIQFTNNHILDAIDAILANSKTKPVIILQGDHSNGWEGNVEWSGKDRLKILSAYYLPDGGDQLLYDQISPINNFRLVFKYYFGDNIDLVNDEWRYLDRATKTVKIAPSSCIPQP